MPEIDLNKKLSELLIAHGVDVSLDEDFVYANLPSVLRFKTRAIYNEVNNFISSQLDVKAIPVDEKMIVESFGDFGADLETAISRNLRNFCMSSLHTLLAAFVLEIEEITNQITIEEWQVNGQVWKAYIGNLTPKRTGNHTEVISPPNEFFNAMEGSIKEQNLNNKIHWFRGYYSQFQNKLTQVEFLKDNLDITVRCPLFSVIPVIPGVEFYSCRNFIVLKKLEIDL